MQALQGAIANPTTKCNFRHCADTSKSRHAVCVKLVTYKCTNSVIIIIIIINEFHRDASFAKTSGPLAERSSNIAHSHSFSLTFANIAISDISLKIDALGICNQFYAMDPESEFGEITQNKGHYAVQGHSRSPSLVPVGNSCNVLLITSYLTLFPIYSLRQVQTRYIRLPLMSF